MNYVIYDADTGRVSRYGSAPESQIDNMAHAGEFVLKNVNGGPDLYVENGTLMKMPPQPSDTHVFDWSSKMWVETATLDILRHRRWCYFKLIRADREFGGFTWDGSVFDSDPQSQARIQGGVQLATMAAAQPFSIDWTLADNTIRTLSAADMIAVGVALAAHVQGVHATARALRAQIEAATTIAEIEAISWPSQP